MINTDNTLKLWWAFFAVLGLCLITSTALADLTDLGVADSEGIWRHAYFKTDKSQSKTLRRNFLSGNSLAKEFAFEGAGDNFPKAKNNTYFSTPRERKKLTSLRDRITLDTNYFNNIFTDTGYVLTSPMRWDKSDWVTVAFIAGVTGTLFFFDEDITGEVEQRAPEAKSNLDSALDDIGSVFEPFGNGSFSIPAMMGFYIYGRYQDNEKAKRTALLAAESFLVTTIFTTALKSMLGRQRPYSGEGADIFKGPSLGKNSFPSGHTSSAFAIATVVANEYENVALVTPISYSIATLTGLSRIQDKNHWASDVFFGATLGYFTAKTILKLHSNKKGRHFTIYPQANSRGGGLIFSNQF
jgi:membrane-associated phospholipid phosphatase